MKARYLFSFFLMLSLLTPVLAYRDLLDLEQLVPGLSIRTSFANDYGDMLSTVTYGQKEYTPEEATEKILSTLRWKERSDCDQLAVAWVKVFGLHGSEVLEDHEGLPKDANGPLSEWLPDGTFRYTAWVRVMTGRHPGRLAQKRVEISPDYKLTVTQLNSPDTLEMP